MAFDCGSTKIEYVPETGSEKESVLPVVPKLAGETSVVPSGLRTDTLAELQHDVPDRHA